MGRGKNFKSSWYGVFQWLGRHFLLHRLLAYFKIPFSLMLCCGVGVWTFWNSPLYLHEPGGLLSLIFFLGNFYLTFLSDIFAFTQAHVRPRFLSYYNEKKLNPPNKYMNKYIFHHDYLYITKSLSRARGFVRITHELSKISQKVINKPYCYYPKLCSCWVLSKSDHFWASYGHFTGKI